MTWDVLQRNLGNRLTPELIMGLEEEVRKVATDEYKRGAEDIYRRMQESQGYDLRVPEAMILDGYRFSLGNYERDLQLFEHLQKMHLAEVETARDPNLIWRCDQEEMIRLARSRTMYIFLIQHANQVIGYMSMQFHKDYGTAQTIGSELHFFIHPDHRKGWLALKFVRWIESVLKNNGITEMRTGVRDIKDVSALYRRLGYRPFGHLFTKAL